MQHLLYFVPIQTKEHEAIAAEMLLFTLAGGMPHTTCGRLSACF